MAKQKQFDQEEMDLRQLLILDLRMEHAVDHLQDAQIHEWALKLL